jgi:hypothetical protein
MRARCFCQHPESVDARVLVTVWVELVSPLSNEVRWCAYFAHSPATMGRLWYTCFSAGNPGLHLETSAAYNYS